MKYLSKKDFSVRVLSLCLVWAICIPLLSAPLGRLMTVAAEEPAYIPPAYLVDYTQTDGVAGCRDGHFVSVEYRREGMGVLFVDAGNGQAEDPYFSLALPGRVDVTKYHYIALLVRTDLHGLRGELRFRTDSTGGEFPCQFFEYADTDDWQLIVVDLTDRSTVQYCPPSLPFEGDLNLLRLDPFNNACPTDTNYEIRACGFYETREAAETFMGFTPVEDTAEPLPDVDYASFWRGEAFATPAPATRLRWLSYGFSNDSHSPVDIFLTQGYGGIVSNVTFTPDYLQNDEQFKILGSVYDYAAHNGMNTWIYDEFQWPSGKAFGQVLEGHGEYEATGVEHRIIQGQSGKPLTFTCEGRDIRILRADIQTSSGRVTLTEADGLTERSVTASASGRWQLHVYVLRYTHDGNETPGDFTTLRHVDLLSKAAVARFIELTHQRYKDKMGESFASVEAFFTDEPQLGNRWKKGYAVWTPGLEARFEAEYGHKLDITALYEGDSVDAMRERMQYFRLVAKLFKEAYIDQISAWCEANGVASSGHLLFEECMTDQIETYGGDFLQIVGGMTIPGVDLLKVDPDHLLSRNFVGNAVGTRYVVSAAKNAGKDRVMVEYNPAATGNPADPLLDCIGGVSMTRLLGTTEYIMLNPQMSLSTDESQTLNTYLGRLNTLLDGATECGELAIFYPIATVQALYNADQGHTSENNQRSAGFILDGRFQTMCQELLARQYLYTVLDDTALQNATVASDGCLCIGKGAYRTIILPYAQFVSAKAMETLMTFRAAGGTVIFVGDKPAYGLVADEDVTVAAAMQTLSDAPAFARAGDDLYAALETVVSRRVQVTAERSAVQTRLLTGEFTADGREIVYLASTVKSVERFTATYTDGYKGAVTVYYPRSGLIETMTVGDGLTVEIPACEAVLIVREGSTESDHLAGHTPYVPESESDTDPVTEPESDPTAAPESDTPAVTNSATETEPTDGKGCASTLGIGILPLLLLAALLPKRKYSHFI